MTVLIGFAGLVIDVGRVFVAQRQLQQAVDAAALVAGQDLPNSAQAYTDAIAYSAAAGAKNQHSGLNSNPSDVTVTFKCYTNPQGTNIPCTSDSSGNSCHPPGSAPPAPSGTKTCNAVSVTETGSVDTTLAHLFLPGFSAVSASATASARGGAP